MLGDAVNHEGDNAAAAIGGTCRHSIGSVTCRRERKIDAEVEKENITEESPFGVDDGVVVAVAVAVAVGDERAPVAVDGEAHSVETDGDAACQFEAIRHGGG